jgi:lipoprotein NlpI
MKKGLAKLGLTAAAIAVLALFAWGTRMALRPISHGLASLYFAQGLRDQRAGNLGAAMTDYNRAIALDSKFSRAYTNRGLVKVDQGHIEEAIADYDRAIALDPKDYRAYLYRAHAREYERDLVGALADFDRTIELYAYSAFAFGRRSRLKSALGDLEGAMKDADQAMAIKPDEYAFNTRGWVKKLKGDLDGARADFKQAIQINPRYAWSYANRGYIECMDGQGDDALKDFREFCALSETEQDYPRIGIWITRVRQGERAEADKELAAYLEVRKPGKLGDWGGYVAKFLVGQISEEELFTRAKATSPKKVASQLCEAWYYAGEKKRLAGDNESAAQYFRKCLETDQKDFIEYAFARAELMALGK